MMVPKNGEKINQSQENSSELQTVYVPGKELSCPSHARPSALEDCAPACHRCVHCNQIKSNQIKSLLLSHHHSTSALVSEILMSVLQTVQKEQQTSYIWTDSAKKKKLHWSIYSAPDSAKKQQQQFTYGQTVQKNNKQFTYGQTVQKNNKQFTYGQAVQKNNKQFTYGQTVQKNNKQFTYGQTVQKNNKQFTYGQTVQKKLHWSIYSAPDSAKKTTTIYIWTVHIYRLYRRQCAKYTYIYSVHSVL